MTHKSKDCYTCGISPCTVYATKFSTKGIGTEVYKAHEFVTAETNKKKKTTYFCTLCVYILSNTIQFDYSDLF